MPSVTGRQEVANLEELVASVEERVKTLKREVKQALVSGAKEGQKELAKRSLKTGRRKGGGTGRMSRSWEVNKLPGGDVELHNTAPYSGIVEVGARPHGMSAEGIARLEQWSLRKFKLSPDEAKRVAQAVAAKIAKEGQKPSFFVKRSQRKLRKLLKEEVTKTIETLAVKNF